MKVSKNWLKEYLDLDGISDEALYDAISMHVCEIESYHPLVEATGLTVGLVKECIFHPNSDHLHICQVEVAPNTIKQIVCGAPNVAAGQKVIVANVGAVLPGDFKIKASKIRGVESLGMLCSLQELGIEEKYIEEEFKNGIYLLCEDAVIGSDPLSYLGLADTVIDLDVTSNRSDLLSIEGVAYDLGAALGKSVQIKTPQVDEVEKKVTLKIEIQTENCLKYTARVIEDVVIAPSPKWMQGRLIACGIRPINNVVDITNYVLLEMGQPLHAFDRDRLGDHIIVRNAKEQEELVTLDGIKRILKSTDIVIANEQAALCLGGVMGGLTSEVEATTKNIVLEAAYFDPLSVRKTSSRLGLKSESSVRFERKIDYQRVERALDYAASLMGKYAGGHVLTGVASCIHQVIAPKYVFITPDKINRVLGTNLDSSAIERIFDRLAYSYEKKDNGYRIELPHRRMDLEENDQDIIEDVARMNGYDAIPTTLAKTSSKGALTEKQQKLRLIRRQLAMMGMNEVTTYSLVSKKSLNDYIDQPQPEIEVLMPLTEERCVLRQSLLNGVVEAVSYNLARKNADLAFFEIGNIYTKEKEELHLAGAITGLWQSLLWRGEKQRADFYTLKGILEVLFAKLNEEVTYRPDQSISCFHPGRCAAIYWHDQKIGVLGALHPRFAKEKDISDTIVFEINLDAILHHRSSFKYQPLNKYPTVSRDLAIVVDKTVLASDLLMTIRKTVRKNLVDLKIFDLYTGEKIASDKKSLALTLTFEDVHKTLTSGDVDQMIQSILEQLQRHYDARLRD